MFKAGSTRERGEAAEALALAHLERHGLRLVSRNYRWGQGRSTAGGEIDLILREHDGTLVFVEVRARRNSACGGAAASIGAVKQRRLRRAAEHFLLRWPVLPPCRFDLVAIEGDQITWLRGAFAMD